MSAKKTTKKSAAKKTAVKRAKSSKRASPVAKAAKKTAAKTTPSSYKPRLVEAGVIRITASEDKPYREGSDAQKHFNAMKGGVTVGTYLKRFGESTDDHRKARQWLWNIIRDNNAKVLGA